VVVAVAMAEAVVVAAAEAAAEAAGAAVAAAASTAGLGKTGSISAAGGLGAEPTGSAKSRCEDDVSKEGAGIHSAWLSRLNFNLSLCSRSCSV
jgi:hypothetical protein